MRFDTIFLGGEMKTGRAINAVSIEQRHCRHIEIHASGDQVFGNRFEIFEI